MDDGTPNAGAALLERAVGYALCAVRGVTPRTLDAPTPCGGWDLRALLWHTADSLAALYEGVEDGYVGPELPEPLPWPEPEPEPGWGTGRGARSGPGPGPGLGPELGLGPDRGLGPDLGPGPGLGFGLADDPAAVFRARASRLLGSWAASDSPADRLVSVDGLPLPAAALAYTGALEIAVHGWDIAQATGLPRPVPAALATQLMRTARQLVPSPATRHPLFGAPVTVPAEADPSDRLVAFLGRDPYGAWRTGRRDRDADSRQADGRDGGGQRSGGRGRDGGGQKTGGQESDGRDGAEGRPAPA